MSNFVQQLFGGGPKITRAREDGTRPWSTTIVNINRLRNKRNRRRNTILGIVAAGVMSCCMCGSVFYAFGPKNVTPPGAPAAQKAIPTQTPKPGWTVVPKQPNVAYQLVTFTPAPPQQTP